MQTYWEYIDWDYRLSDCEFDSADEALEAANEAYAEFVHPDSGSDKIDLIQFSIDDDGNRTEILRKSAWVAYGRDTYSEGARFDYSAAIGAL
jgi:hypothetical protein